MSRLAASRACARQRGVALLVVLWACTLLAIVLGGYAMLARNEGLQARYQFAQLRAHYAAEAGMTRAIYALLTPSPDRRWIPDGREYPFQFDDAKVGIRIVDESGKVDINASSPEVLKALFRAAGMNDGPANELATRVVEWRSFGNPGDLNNNAAYLAAGRDYGPRHGPFTSLEELQMVLGMDPATYRKISTSITIWSGRNAPDPNYAPALAMQAIPGMSADQANAAYAARQQAGTSQGLGASQGVTHSIRSEATLPDGTRAILRATVRLQGARAGAQPYALLRWQEGDGE